MMNNFKRILAALTVATTLTKVSASTSNYPDVFWSYGTISKR